MHEKELSHIQALITIFFPIAEELLGKFRELHPFAGATTHDGEFVSVGNHQDKDQKNDETLISHLKQSLRDGMKDYLVAAVLYDVRTRDTQSGAVVDAIAVFVEHRDGSSAYEFFYPYRWNGEGIEFDESYGNPVGKEIFG